MADRTVFVQFKGKKDGSVDAAMNAVPAAAEKAKAKTIGIWSAIGSAIGNTIANFATRGVDYISGLAKEAIDASDATDKFRATLDFAGLKPGAIESVTKQVRKYADDTVYGLGDVQNMAAQLAANGVKGFVGLTKAAGNLNAIAGGNKDTFKSVAMVMTQTAGAGKLTTENWNQLADAIPGASGKVQQQLKKNGAYTGDFRTAMAKGQITAKEFNKAVSQLGNKPVAVEAAKSTKTFEGALGNLEATIVGKLSDAFDKLKPTITTAMGALVTGIEWVSDNAGTIGNVATGIGILAGAFGALQIAQSAAAAGGFAKYALQVMKATKLWAIAQGALNLVMSANPLAIVVIAIAALVGAIIVAYNTSEDFRKVCDTAFAGIAAAGRWLWNNGLQPVLQGIVKGFAWAAGGIANFLDGLSNVPGFGWAKGAADGLRRIADSATQAANGIRKIPDPKVNTGKSNAEIEKLKGRIKSIQGKIVTAKAKGDTKEVTRLQNALAKVKSKLVTVTANVRKTGVTAIKLTKGASDRISVLAVARGAIFPMVGAPVRKFASGGFENHTAQIARAGAMRVWAEPETGGEAYIPLSPTKRKRSRQIWWETGRRLGMIPYAGGGIDDGGQSSAGSVEALLGAIRREQITKADIRDLIEALRAADNKPRAMAGRSL